MIARRIERRIPLRCHGAPLGAPPGGGGRSGRRAGSWHADRLREVDLLSAQLLQRAGQHLLAQLSRHGSIRNAMESNLKET